MNVEFPPVLGPPGGKPGCEHETRPGTLVRSGDAKRLQAGTGADHQSADGVG
jgi:hypothetical protein